MPPGENAVQHFTKSAMLWQAFFRYKRKISAENDNVREKMKAMGTYQRRGCGRDGAEGAFPRMGWRCLGMCRGMGEEAERELRGAVTRPGYEGAVTGFCREEAGYERTPRLPYPYTSPV